MDSSVGTGIIDDNTLPDAVPSDLKSVQTDSESVILINLFGHQVRAIMPARLLVLTLMWIPFAHIAGCGSSVDGELKAAENTAELFLTAVVNKDGSSAYGLLSTDYRERLSEKERSSKSFNLYARSDEIQTVRAWYWGGAGHSKLSASRDRATLKGSFAFEKTRDGDVLSTDHSCDFTMVLTKEKGD